MNKFTKLILTSAIISTSGFATQQDGGTISGVGQIDQGATMEMEAGIKATMDNKAVIHNYHIIQGPASDDISTETVVGDENKATISGLADGSKAVIQGTSEEKIINYDHIMEKDEDFAGLDGFEVTTPTYFRPTGGAKIQGAVDTTDVTVTSAIADLIHAIDLHNEGTDVMLLTTNCQEEDKTMRLTNSDKEQVIVKANIANEIATGDTSSNSHSLVVRGAFRFEGDQSRFNQTDTTLKFKKSHSEIGTSKSLFMTPIDVEEESKLVIDAAGVEMPHDVTITNSKFIVNPNASFTLKPGARLLFKYTEGVLTISYPSENPTQMTWNVGDFTNELTEYYVYQNKNGIYCEFWKEGEEWKTIYEGISLVESGDKLVFTKTYNEETTTAEIPLSDIDKKYNWENRIVYEAPDSEHELGPSSSTTLHFAYAHDNVFSYDYDTENDTWVRRNQNLIVPANFDLSTITSNNSTWLVLKGEENIFSIKNSSSGGNAAVNLAEISGDKLSNRNIDTLYLNSGFKVQYTYTFQGTEELGYWGDIGNSHTKEIADALASGQTWMTLEEYNTANGTSYTWR